MNKIFSLVWNRARQKWIVASEKVASRGGIPVRNVGVLCAAASLATAATAFALPSGNTLVAGQATVSNPSATQMNINQTTSRAIINWQSFGIASGEAVNIIQPSSQATLLNRVIGNSSSEIFGKLTANGQVFLVNPNGILFGRGAEVNVGGLVASTLNTNNDDFMNGVYKFYKDGTNGSVINQGTINGSFVALLDSRVENSGTITATKSAALSAGDAITLSIDNTGLLAVRVDQGAYNAQVQNSGIIEADGGRVVLTAKSADDIMRSVVNNTGTIRARTIENRSGEIYILGDMDNGTVNVGGTLDASAPNGGNGGFVETSAANVQVLDSARVTTHAAQGKTGTWLIDPNDYTIAAAGGNITGAQLSTNLTGTSITISTAIQGTSGGNGDIFVNDTVTWSANILTLNAERNITVNSQMNGSGTAGLSLLYGQGDVAAGNTSSYTINAPVNLASTGSFNTKLGSDGTLKTYTIITSLGEQGSTTGTDLQGINGNLSGNYVLGSTIDASATSGWNSDGSGGFYGFSPIANGSSFTGAFDGLGHTISNLYINRPAADFVGLFKYVGTDSIIRNVGLVGGSVTGQLYTGGLAGYVNNGSIINAYTTGAVTGTDIVGGLAGVSSNSSISNSYATGAVTGTNYAGGLVGYTSVGSISNSYATGAVSATGTFVGGLVGDNSGGTITNSYATGAVSATGTFVGGLAGMNTGSISTSYATGAVTGTDIVGGLAGVSSNSSISNSYATGAVNGTDYVGGLVGYTSVGSISNSYATGAVTGTSNVGGLVGDNSGGTITNSYATGAVSATGTFVGGLAGQNTGSISSSYWDTTTSGTSTGVGTGTTSDVTGLITADMMTYSIFNGAGWSIANSGGSSATWRIYEDQSYPLLRAFLTPLTVTANDYSKTYDGIAYSGGNGVTYSVTGAGTSPNLLGTLAYSGTSQGAVDVGNYAIIPGGLYSNQQGYDIAFANGQLTVNAVPIPAPTRSVTTPHVFIPGISGNSPSVQVSIKEGPVVAGTINTTGSGFTGVGSGTGGDSDNSAPSAMYSNFKNQVYLPVRAFQYSWKEDDKGMSDQDINQMLNAYTNQNLNDSNNAMQWWAIAATRQESPQKPTKESTVNSLISVKGGGIKYE